ncbi:MAG TPA: hypothetical protein EYN66_06435 [Myxococcales bacterium]|nr:hypothetical protein [Myxococcales bacterium]
MARKKKGTRRRRKTWSILNGLEALAYGQILSVGITGGGIWEFATGATDLGFRSNRGNLGITGVEGTGMSLVGTSQISLGDFMSQPSLAIEQMTGNFQSNIIPMAIAGFTTSIAFRVGRRLLRKPISMVSRDLVKPVFGPGVRL